MKPRLLANKRGQHWLQHPHKVNLYGGWAMCPMSWSSEGNPRLIVYFDTNQVPVDGRIDVFDLWLPDPSHY